MRLDYSNTFFRATALLLVFVASLSIGQTNAQTVHIPLQDEYDEDEEEDPWKGFSYGLNLGVYWASKQSAAFYNGTCFYSVNEINGRCYSIEERIELLRNGTNNQQYNQLLDELGGASQLTVPRDTYPARTRFKGAPFVGLHLKYSFNRTNAIFTDINVFRIKMVDVFTVETDLPPAPGESALNDPQEHTIVGKEDRLQIALGYHTANPMQGDFNWYFDAAATLLATKPLENYIQFNTDRGTRFDLLLAAAPGVQQGLQTFRPQRTHVGFGAQLGTGLEFYFQDKYFMNLGFQISYEDVSVGSFEKYLFNKALVARFTL